MHADHHSNRPGLRHHGAGETVYTPTMAAIAEGVHTSTTGLPLRRMPLTDARVRAALEAAHV